VDALLPEVDLEALPPPATSANDGLRPLAAADAAVDDDDAAVRDELEA